MGAKELQGIGGMAAILKLNENKVEELLNRAGEFGIVEGANYNCPGQVVIAGEIKAINAAIDIAKTLGGMAVPLNVSGPFHSSLLTKAAEEFSYYLKSTEFSMNSTVVYSNVLGEPYQKGHDIRNLLEKQIRSAVLFEKTIRNMIDNGVTTFIEVGPGKALRGFVKKIDRKIEVYGVEDIKSLRNTLEALA